MPQLEPSTYLSQIFWLIITFSSLWFVMSWFILPRIKNILEERQQKIENHIQKAEKINKQALLSLERYEKSLAQAKLEADQKIADEKTKLDEDIAQKTLELNELLASKISQNEELLKKERAETLSAIDEVSLKMAELILQKLNLASTDKKDARNS